MSEIKFTQRMTTHLNGGSEFSELHFAVFADDRPTPIMRVRRTDGSPRYRITHDVFICGEDRFDVLETKGVGLMQWLRGHVDSIEAARAEAHGDDSQ